MGVTIRGHVIDKVTRLPIADAAITLRKIVSGSFGSPITISLDADGEFEQAVGEPPYTRFEIKIDKDPGYVHKFVQFQIASASWHNLGTIELEPYPVTPPDA